MESTVEEFLCGDMDIVNSIYGNYFINYHCLISINLCLCHSDCGRILSILLPLVQFIEILLNLWTQHNIAHVQCTIFNPSHITYSKIKPKVCLSTLGKLSLKLQEAFFNNALSKTKEGKKQSESSTTNMPLNLLMISTSPYSSSLQLAIKFLTGVNL